MSLRIRLALAAVGIVVATACASVVVGDLAARGATDGTTGRPGFTIVVVTIICGIPAIALAVWLARAVVYPINRAAELAEAVLAGRDIPSVVLGGHGDVDGLIAAIVAVQHALATVLSDVRSAADRLGAIEGGTTAALDHEESAVRAFSGAAAEIAAAVVQITATSERLLDSTETVMARAREAAAVADEGRDGIEQMTDSMQHLDEAMNAFSRKLASISQRAAGITAVVTTIAKVAEQTNLLSVNATIEAEKAGESGRGFRIVAQEIRRLADQTGQSTKDIERLVRDMQAAVAGGTMEMDRFRNEVSGRMREVATVSEQLGRIIDPVQVVTGSMERIHEGMATQLEGARHIRRAIESLRGDVANSAASVDALKASVTCIRETVADLESALSVVRPA
jgi:methyl-accepting chemotaxis protein WspA